MDDNHHSNILGETDAYFEDDDEKESDLTENEENDEFQDEIDHGQHILQTTKIENFEMTPTHSKILILISKYGKTASAEEPEESWIRQLPLTVMMYEGITAGAIDCDYAPKSAIISSDGMFLPNASHDAHSPDINVVVDPLQAYVAANS